MAKNLVICDFDGTVNRFDVTSNILKKYLGESWDRINKDYHRGKLTNYCIYNDFLLPLLRKKGREIFESTDRFLSPAKGFADFYSYCQYNGFELVILSDGFDFYIRRFLEKYGFSINFVSNAVFSSDGRDYKLIMPYHNFDCKKCGVCKSFVMNRIIKGRKNSVYIGDGFSDICSSRLPKAFFGKRKILNYLRQLKHDGKAANFYFYDFLRLKTLFEKKEGYRSVIFDLDGTIVDGFGIIYESFNYALEQLGLKKLSEREIRKVIGPSLSEGFRRLVPESLVERGVDIYRSYYKKRYLKRNKVFYGMREILRSLKKKGVITGLITNKKEPFAVELVKYLKLKDYLDFVFGADDGLLPKPATATMEKVMKVYGLKEKEIVYVGDSEIDGAFSQNCGVDFIAVGTGLGNESALYRYKPLTFCNDTGDLDKILNYLIPRKV